MHIFATSQPSTAYSARLLSLAIPIMILFGTGCGPGVKSGSPLPPPDSSLDAIWSYAADLQVQDYANRRFGDLSDGLRRANQEHRIRFFTFGRMFARPADLQCFLYFEYRRRQGLPAHAALDAETVRYVRALVEALNES